MELNYSKPVHRITLSPLENEILTQLKESGEKGFLAGGTLRERLLNHADDPDRDIDIVTTASKETLLYIFADKKIITDPYKPGLYKIFTPEGIKIDIFQSEPLKKSLKTHTEHCDFTMNACFADADGQVFDLSGRGMRDLMEGKLETVQPTDQSFAECPIRMLRVLYFATQGNLIISDEIKQSIQKHAHLLLMNDHLSYTNAWIHKLLSRKGAPANFNLLIDLGLLKSLFPSIADHLIKDRQWICDMLSKIQHAKPSLDQVYMIFLTSMMQQNPYEDPKQLKNLINENQLFEQNYNHKYCNLNRLQINLIQSWKATHPILSLRKVGPASGFFNDAPTPVQRHQSNHALSLTAT